jgi:3'(2'), 5'-bisphosphate nucleotidase
MDRSLPESLGVSNETISRVLSVLLEAGKIALQYHQSDKLNIQYKIDDSPVTNADIEVNDFIIEQLNVLTPNIDIISEENETNYLSGHTFWLLDPIDGTKNYIKGHSGYTINLALVYKNLPVLGFIYHPSLGEIFYNDLDGQAVCYDIKEETKIIQIPQKIVKEIRVIIYKKQLNLLKIEKELQFAKVYPSNARSKISMLFSGQADVYYLYRPLMEWDTASGHAILRALGGDIIDMDGNVLVYGKPLFVNSNIIACNQNALSSKQIILNNN